MSGLSALNLAEDFERALAAEDAARWSLEKPGELEIWATLSSAAKPEESFQARLLWEQYPERPPSLKFRDPATGRLDLPSAWPVVRGMRPASLDACVNWCSEGFALHPEWANDRRYCWDPRGNALLRVLRNLQAELDADFNGRFKG